MDDSRFWISFIWYNPSKLAIEMYVKKFSLVWWRFCCYFFIVGEESLQVYLHSLQHAKYNIFHSMDEIFVVCYIHLSLLLCRPNFNSCKSCFCWLAFYCVRMLESNFVVSRSLSRCRFYYNFLCSCLPFQFVCVWNWYFNEDSTDKFCSWCYVFVYGLHAQIISSVIQ